MLCIAAELSSVHGIIKLIMYYIIIMRCGLETNNEALNYKPRDILFINSFLLLYEFNKIYTRVSNQFCIRSVFKLPSTVKCILAIAVTSVNVYTICFRKKKIGIKTHVYQENSCRSRGP